MKKISKKLIIALIIVVVLVGGFYAMSQYNVKPELKTYIVEKRDMKEYIEETGTVKSYSERKIISNVQAKPVSIDFEVGDKVKKGQVLIKFDESKINSDIKVADAKLKQVQASYRESVKPADKEKVKALEANISNIEIEIDDLNRVLKKSEELLLQGAISEEEVTATKKQLATLNNQLLAAQNDLKLLTKSVTADIRAGYEAQISEIKENINALQDMKDDYTIVAPIDGVITDKFIKENGLATPGMELLDLSSSNDLYVEADVLVNESKGIDIGDSVIVYNEDLGLNIEGGKLSKIAPKAYSKVSDLGIEQKRVKVEVDLAGSAEGLKEGYDVDVRIIKNVKPNVLVIKDVDTYEIDEEQYVDILEDGKMKQTKIKTGIKEGEYVEVLEGLNDKDVIVEKIK